ncbi:MAG: efflux RND transporter periplasmic adaptor subunit [Steroidobacter sp.]
MHHDIFTCSRLFRASLLCSTLAFAGCGDSPQGQENGDKAVAVTTQRVESRPLPLMIETVGRTEGSREIELRARVSGILEKQVYSEGSKVKSGDTLFRIDPVPYEIALAHARAALAQQRAVQQQAQRTADRLMSLAKQNAVSQRQADDALSAVEAADAAILAAQATVREAEINLSYTRVIAPIGGIAGRAEQSEGSLVTAGAESSLLTTVAQTDPIWVRFALSVQEYDALRAAGASNASALSVELLAADGKPHPLKGGINFAGSTVDPTLGTVQLRAEFENPRLVVLPGEYLRVRLTGGETPGVAVPQTAVLQGAKGPFVWIVDAEGKAKQREVQTGAWIGNDWRIRAGLTEGDTLILDNLLKLKPGQAVTARLPQSSESQQAREKEQTLRSTASTRTGRNGG